MGSGLLDSLTGSSVQTAFFNSWEQTNELNEAAPRETLSYYEYSPSLGPSLTASLAASDKFKKN